MRKVFSPSSWLGIGLTAICLALYVITLTPGVPPTDSGELALAAWLPGIAHAPGFPLYVLLGWLWTHLLPVGRVVWRLNLFSAVMAALAVGLTYALARLTLLAPGGRGRGDAQSASPVPDQWYATLTAAAAALTLGLGRTVWGWATVAEVYTLNLALTAAVLLLIVSYGGLRSAAPAPKPRAEKLKSAPASAAAGRSRSAASRRAGNLTPIPAPRRSGEPAPPSLPGKGSGGLGLLAAAFLFGLGLGNHLTSIALLAPAIAFWLTARLGWRFWLRRTVWIAAVALAAGAAVYLYLPLRAAADPLLNWGQPDTWQRFWWHVTARQYRVSLLSAPVWPQIQLAGQWAWTQFTPIGLGLLMWGAWRMARKDRALFGLLALVIACTLLYAWAYVIEDDGDAYYLPAFLAAAIWVAWGADGLVRWFVGRLAQATTKGQVAVTVVTLAILPALSLTMNGRACDRRGDTISEDYVRDAFAEIGQGGLLLTRDWQLYGPAFYLQQVEGLRPDLTVIDTELLRRGWYFDYLHRVDPRLMAAVASQERTFLALRDAWERGKSRTATRASPSFRQPTWR